MCLFWIRVRNLIKYLIDSITALFLVDAGSKIYIWQGWVPEDSPEEESVSSVTGSTFLRFTFARRAALQTAIAFATKKEKLIKSKQLNNGTFSVSS